MKTLNFFKPFSPKIRLYCPIYSKIHIYPATFKFVKNFYCCDYLIYYDARFINIRNKYVWIVYPSFIISLEKHFALKQSFDSKDNVVYEFGTMRYGMIYGFKKFFSKTDYIVLNLKEFYDLYFKYVDNMEFM